MKTYKITYQDNETGKIDFNIEYSGVLPSASRFEESFGGYITVLSIEEIKAK